MLYDDLTPAQISCLVQDTDGIAGDDGFDIRNFRLKRNELRGVPKALWDERRFAPRLSSQGSVCPAVNAAQMS